MLVYVYDYLKVLKTKFKPNVSQLVEWGINFQQDKVILKREIYVQQ